MHGIGYYRSFFWAGAETLTLSTKRVLARPPNYTTYTGASSSQLRKMTSVVQKGSTGAYSTFQRFALEAPVHSHFSTKEERASAFPDFRFYMEIGPFFPFLHTFFTYQNLLLEATGLEQLHLFQRVSNGSGR